MPDSTNASCAKGSFICTAVIVGCSMGLFFLGLSWLLGGNDYKDSFLGDYAFAFLTLGLVASIVLMRISSRKVRRGACAENSTGPETGVDYASMR